MGCSCLRAGLEHVGQHCMSRRVGRVVPARQILAQARQDLGRARMGPMKVGSPTLCQVLKSVSYIEITRKAPIEHLRKTKA
jgi:hypothetical protein